MVYENIIAMVTNIESYIYTIALGILILLIGFSIGILAKKLALKILRGIGINSALRKAGVIHDVEKTISSFSLWIIYLFTMAIFLEYLGVKYSAALYLVAGGILALLMFTILVGLKDLVPNFAGWFYLQKQEQIRRGKKIEVKEIVGVVEKVGYLETKIKTKNGDILYVPNLLFIQSKHKAP